MKFEVSHWLGVNKMFHVLVENSPEPFDFSFTAADYLHITLWFKIFFRLLRNNG